MPCPKCGKELAPGRPCPCGYKPGATAPLRQKGTAPLLGLFGRGTAPLGFGKPNERLTDQGIKLFGEGRNAEAAAILHQALAQDEADHLALTTLGRIETLEGKYRDAEEHLSLAVETGSTANAHFFLGDLYYLQKEFFSAERHFKRATALDPKLLDAHLRLGLLYQEQGRKPEAVRAFEQAIYMDRTSVPARLFLAQLCIQMEDFKRALAQLHYISALENATVETLMLRGDIHHKLGDLRQASIEYARALELKGDDPELCWKHGSSLLALGEKRKALRALRKTIELDPSRSNAVLVVAQLQEEALQYTQALHNYERLLDAPGYETTAQEGIERVQARLEAIRADMEGN
ncbi:MAG: tetratricopeptide repeat protein [Bacteroidota bacterium]